MAGREGAAQLGKVLTGNEEKDHARKNEAQKSYREALEVQVMSRKPVGTQQPRR